MLFPPEIQQWAETVQYEIEYRNYPFEPELILSIIKYESNGRVGIVNSKSGASGLMQVMPNSLKWYEDSTGENIGIDHLRGHSQTDADLQIRVGLWILGQFWKNAYKWLREKNDEIPVSELVKFGQAFYVAGPGRIKDLARNITRNWISWQTKYPSSNITIYTNKIWNSTNEQHPNWDLMRIDEFVEEEGSNIWKRKKDLIIALGIILIASFFLKNLGEKNETDQ